MKGKKRKKKRRHIHEASNENKSTKGADKIQSCKKKIIMEFLFRKQKNISEYCLVFGIILTIEYLRRQSEKEILQIRRQMKQFAVS